MSGAPEPGRRAGAIENIARSCARRPGRTIAAWGLALGVSVALVAALLGSALTSESEMTNDPESYRAYDLLHERVPATPETRSYGKEIVLVRSASVTVDDARFRRKLEEVARAIEATGATLRVRTPGRDGDAELIAPSRRAAVVEVAMGPDPAAGVERVITAALDAGDREFEITITGEWTADRDLMQLSGDDLKRGELFFGLPAAVIVLLLVFGAVVAGLVPLLLALASIVVALGLTAVVGQAFDLSVFVVNMLSGMGLALGIDYSLFVLSRYREERALGAAKAEAIATSAATSSRAIVFSGVAFVLAMLGMVLVPDTILRSLAAGAILVGLVAVAAALTLLPALLSLLGDRIEALAIPLVRRRGEGGLWPAVVRGVMRRPLVSLLASVAVLLAATAPALQLEIGFAGVRTIPDRFPSKQGFAALEREFGVGTVDSMEIVVDGDGASPPVRRAIERLRRALAASPDFRAPSVEVHAEQRLAVLEALPVGDSRDERVLAAVERIRHVEVPALFAGTGARVLVTGETAEAIDYLELVERWLPLVVGFVLGLTFVLLTVAFRSLVVPLKAVLLNLLSVGAAYGLLVLVFQHGVGNELFGFQQVEALEAWLPLFLFSVLFGLSMDYHVFLLSRIRERFTETGDNDDAVSWGVGSTARLITGAALIIVVVFAGFARGELVMFQQLGFGVAVSLLIDATLIRTVLVPAAMKLLHDKNWYLPGWLQWLPHASVEGASRSTR